MNAMMRSVFLAAVLSLALPALAQETCPIRATSLMRTDSQ